MKVYMKKKLWSPENKKVPFSNNVNAVLSPAPSLHFLLSIKKAKMATNGHRKNQRRVAFSHQRSLCPTAHAQLGEDERRRVVRHQPFKQLPDAVGRRARELNALLHRRVMRSSTNGQAAP